MRRRPFLLTSLLRAVQATVVVLLCYGAYVLGLQANNNFHTVIAGEFYRSGQPDGAQIADYTKRYGIRSIINLRGENANYPWYQEEIAASQQAHVKHFDFRMKASRELTEAQARELIALMHTAPKPVLVHCMHGSDRSGLAAALYIATDGKDSVADAGKQLSLVYGHIPFSFSSAYAMTRSFNDLKPTLEAHPQASLK